MESAGKMPKSYKSSSVEGFEKEKPFQKAVEKVAEEKHALPPSKAVQSIIDAKIVVTGNVSGNRYEFAGAGSVVDVDERDVENLLAKRRGGRSCCGGDINGKHIFSLA